MSSFCPTTDRKGFSLVEMLVSLGIFTVLLMVVMFMLNFFWTKQLGLENQISNRLDLAVVEKFIFRDLVFAFPSMGNLTTPTANGMSFFDIYTSTPLTRIAPAPTTRTYVLDVTNGAKGGSLEFIVEMPKGDPALGNGQARHQNFQPHDAYGGPPLLFLGLDSGKFFTTYFPTLATQAAHFYFFSPASIRTQCGLLVCPDRYYSILLYSAGGGKYLPDDMGGTFNFNHPMYAGRKTLDVDQWLRNLPAVGGAMSTVYVSPVYSVRYRLAPDLGNKSGRLYRSVKSGLSYQSETLIGTDINRITFLRPDVTSPLVQFNVELKR